MLHSVLKLSLYMIGWCWLVNCSVLIPFQTIRALRMTFLNWSARVLHVALPWGTCLESGHSSRISCIPRPLARSDTDTKNEETADVGSLKTFEQGAFVAIGSDPIVKLYTHIILYTQIDSMRNHAQKDIRQPHTPSWWVAGLMKHHSNNDRLLHLSRTTRWLTHVV